MQPTAAPSGRFSRQYENVNGALLTLSVQKASEATVRQHRRFTVSFGGLRSRGGTYAVFPRLALTVAIVFNILAVLYTQLALHILALTVCIFSVLTLLWLTHSVQYESVLVVPTVGIQNSIKYVRGSEEHFIPWSSIEDVIINEVVHLNRVLYYLTVLVEDSGETKLIPLFKYTKPRLAMLEKIYSEIKILLSTKEQEANRSGSGDGDT